MSSTSPLHGQAAQHFDERFIRKQIESFLSQPEQTIWVSRHRTLRTQYLHLGVLLWKQYKILASYKDFCKLQFLFMYFFTHINKVFLFKHLAAEILIFKNICYWMKCFSDDSFSFFQEQVLLIFLLLFWFHKKFKQVFKNIKISWTVHSRPFWQMKYQLIGVFSLVLDIQWIHCQYL